MVVGLSAARTDLATLVMLLEFCSKIASVVGSERGCPRFQALGAEGYLGYQRQEVEFIFQI